MKIEGPASHVSYVIIVTVARSQCSDVLSEQFITRVPEVTQLGYLHINEYSK